jgi:hypothetical protein
MLEIVAVNGQPVNATGPMGSVNGMQAEADELGGTIEAASRPLLLRLREKLVVV